MQKKGELTSTQIITIILAIVGFIIVLIVLFTIMDTETQTQKDICHLSVVTRGTSPETTQKYIPLECTTEKICITTKDECPEFVGEENKREVKIPGGKNQANIEESARIIEKTTVESMYDCWSMMGQGKIDLFSKGATQYLGFTEAQLMCVICSRIALNIPDKEEETKILSKVDINEYIASTNVPQKEISYLSAFAEDKGTSTYAKFDETALTRVKESKISTEKTSQTSNEMAIVFSQIKSEEYGEVAKNLLAAGATVAGASFFTPGTGLVRKVVGATIGAKGAAAILIPAAAGITIYTMNNVHSGQVASAGYCGNFISQKGNSAKGCTTVQTVPYEFKTINEICAGGIDGNP